MANVNHADLTGSQLHEPKGVASAAANTVYTANGSGSGAWTDVNTLLTTTNFTTGDAKLTLKAIADSGWVMMNDGTIGDALSSGTTRANNDCEALFTLIWNNVSNTYAAVSGGRGANAAADWAAHKTIALTKTAGRTFIGLGVGPNDFTATMGMTGGSQYHTLTTTQMPVHAHTGTTGNGSANHTHTFTTGVESATHTHDFTISTLSAVASGAGLNAATGFGTSGTGAASNSHTHSGTTNADGATHTHSFTTNSEGSGASHNNMQSYVAWNIMLKL